MKKRNKVGFNASIEIASKDKHDLIKLLQNSLALRLEIFSIEQEIRIVIREAMEPSNAIYFLLKNE